MQKTKMKKRCSDEVTCVVLCTLPSIYLVCVVFGTAIPTSFYIFGKCFSYFKYKVKHAWHTISGKKNLRILNKFPQCVKLIFRDYKRLARPLKTGTSS